MVLINVIIDFVNFFVKMLSFKNSHFSQFLDVFYLQILTPKKLQHL